MNIKELGIFTRCQEVGLDYEHFHKIAGAHEVIEYSDEAVDTHKKVAKAVYKIMEVVGKSHTKAAQHINALTVKPGWDDHRNEAIDVIYKYFAGSEHIKQAGLVAPVFTAGKALALLAVLTGAGAGALYWQLKRDSQLESSKAESIKSQTQYYEQLAGDLENSMAEKYNYDEPDEPDESDGPES